MEEIRNCFIRVFDYKTAYYLCGKLHGIGYEGVQNDSMKYVDTSLYKAFEEAERHKQYKVIITAGNCNFDIHYKKSPNKHDINCGTNKDLFLAISALILQGKDTDYMLLFCNDKCNKWKLCKENSFDDKEFHKATIEEILEHFKGRY